VEKLTHKLGGFLFGDLVSLVVHDVAGAAASMRQALRADDGLRASW
jgi:hypothetical protein